jgi:hypothetical protein
MGFSFCCFAVIRFQRVAFPKVLCISHLLDTSLKLVRELPLCCLPLHELQARGHFSFYCPVSVSVLYFSLGILFKTCTSLTPLPTWANGQYNQTCKPSPGKSVTQLISFLKVSVLFQEHLTPAFLCNSPSLALWLLRSCTFSASVLQTERMPWWQQVCLKGTLLF